MIIYEDNQSAICIAKNPRDYSKTKRVDIKFHFVCNHVDNQNIKLEYYPTDEMIADIMTKGLNVNKYEKFRKLCGVHDVLQVEKEC